VLLEVELVVELLLLLLLAVLSPHAVKPATMVVITNNAANFFFI
jgi:hypothetical protein